MKKQSLAMIAVHSTADPTMGIWPKVRKFDKDFYKYDMGNISCRFTSRELFLKFGGFNTRLIAAEDYDVHNRMLQSGGKVGFIDAEELNLGEPTSFWNLMQKHYYYGKMMVKFKTSGGVVTFSNVSPIRGGYLKQWKIFLQHPILTILFEIYQIARFTAGAIGGWRIIPWLVKSTMLSR